jgi:intraflagellar transport protein 88
MAKEFNRAKEIYLEAIGVEVDCVEAIFNLGLANIQLGLVGDAIQVSLPPFLLSVFMLTHLLASSSQAFEKLHSLLPNNSEVIYHIANLFEAHREDLATASKWFNLLLARVPTDPGILARLGQIANREGDESQVGRTNLHFFSPFAVLC